jgi:hypothetical protein
MLKGHVRDALHLRFRGSAGSLNDQTPEYGRHVTSIVSGMDTRGKFPGFPRLMKPDLQRR